MARYDEKTDENRRSYTLLPRKPKPRNAHRADCGNDKPPTSAYTQGWTPRYFQSGLCGNLSLPRYFHKGRGTDNVDDIKEQDVYIQR